MRLHHWLFFLIVSTLPLVASPEFCAALRTDYTKRMDVWTSTLKATKDIEAQKAIYAQRPDAMQVAAKMWKTIQPQLTQEWTLEHAAWLLKFVCTQQIEAQKTEATQLRGAIVSQITKAIAEKHLKSANLAPACLGLLAVGDKTSLKLLEKIDAENPSRRVQGVAALSVAYLLAGLGDDPEIMRRRLTLIRKAIIESHDVRIDGVTIADLASDQLYVIRYLSKGRQAPELIGTDQLGAARKLSDAKGKVVVLLFWSDTMGDAEHFLEMTRALFTKSSGENMEIFGVFKGEIATLRALHADQHVTWLNLTDTTGALAKSYRISHFPTALVLDTKGAIHYSGNLGSFVELTADALLNP